MSFSTPSNPCLALIAKTMVFAQHGRGSLPVRLSTTLQASSCLLAPHTWAALCGSSLPPRPFASVLCFATTPAQWPRALLPPSALSIPLANRLQSSFKCYFLRKPVLIPHTWLGPPDYMFFQHVVPSLPTIYRNYK